MKTAFLAANPSRSYIFDKVHPLMCLCGWIPNISGLSFRLVNPLDYRYDRIVGDVIHKRTPLCVSILADLRDEASASSGLLQYTRIVVLFSEVNDRTMEGYVWFFDEHQKSAAQRQDIPWIQKLNNLQEASYKDYKSLLDDWRKAYTKDCQKCYVYVMKVWIAANGLVCITHRESSVKRLDKEAQETNIQQAFYFLKSMFHKDRFHRPANEQIIQLQQGLCPVPTFPQPKAQRAFFDYVTQKILNHIAEVRKRNNLKPHLLQEMLGVLSYAKSANRYGNGTFSKDIDLLEEVITHELDKKPAYPVDIYQFANDLKSFVVIIFAILTPGILLHYNKCNSNPNGIVIGDYFWDIAVPWYGIGVLIGIVFTVVLRLVHDKTLMTSYLFVVLRKFWGAALLKLHTLNKTYTQANSFSISKVISWLIDTEMRIRRMSLHWEKIFLNFILFIFLVYFTYFGYKVKENFHMILPDLNTTQKVQDTQICLQGNHRTVDITPGSLHKKPNITLHQELNTIKK